MGDVAVGPAAPAHLAQRQPDLAVTGPGQGGLEDLRQHQRVVEGIVGLHLAHAPMRGQRLQPQVLRAQGQPPGQLDRAHHAVDRQFRANQLGFGRQEAVVEAHVVGHQGAAPQDVTHLVDDVAEGRLALQHLGRQSVHMGGPGIDPGFSKVATLRSTLPSSPTARAATLTIRACPGRNPVVSTSTTAQPAPGSSAGLPHALLIFARMAREPDNLRRRGSVSCP